MGVNKRFHVSTFIFRVLYKPVLYCNGFEKVKLFLRGKNTFIENILCRIFVKTESPFIFALP
jgi:hypothetical protein